MTGYAEVSDAVVIAIYSERVDSSLVEVSDDVLPGWRFVEGDWFPPDPVAVTPDAVKDEAHRRILEIVPEWKQRNLLAQGTVLLDKGRENWTAEELADWDAAQLIWAQVRAIRGASDAIEAIEPVPQDYTDDKYWQEQPS